MCGQIFDNTITRKIDTLKGFNAFMHLSILTPRGGGGGGGGGWRDTQWELDNFEKSLTNSPPIGKNFVSKIPWMGHNLIKNF